MPALSGGAIRERFRAPLQSRLVITPLLDRRSQIQGSSVDLRLGTDFLVSTRSKVAELDPADKKYHQKLKESFVEFQVPVGGAFVLHPRQFMLGSTLEYLRFPPDLMGYVEGRSSWGRLGLIIATATVVSPGFAGVLTFEIANVGEVPVRLRAGARIAQIVIHDVRRTEAEKQSGEGGYVALGSSKFRMPVGPELGRLDLDSDGPLLERYLGRHSGCNAVTSFIQGDSPEAVDR